MAKNDSQARFFVYRFSVAIAAVLAVICVVADYLVSNMSYPIFDSSTQLATIGWLRRMADAPRNLDANLLMVNVAYDKAFVPVIDPTFGDTIGVRAITDRAKLLEFLNRIGGADYRYLFVDVRFDREDTTPSDSVLFARIVDTPRLSVSTHRHTVDNDFEIADSALLASAGYSDYRHWRFDNFSHYELLQDGHPSVALRMYREINGGDINAHWLGYTSHGRLCYNSIFLPLTSVHRPAGQTAVDADADVVEMSFLNLGADLLERMSADELRALVCDKIIVVGDYENDRHLTYVGEVSGPMLTYYAYRELSAGHHYVPVAYVLALFILYFIMGLGIMSSRPWYEVMLDNMGIKLRIVRFTLSLIGVSLLMTGCMILFYMVWGVSLKVIVPMLVFSLLSVVVGVKKYLENNKPNDKENEQNSNAGGNAGAGCSPAQRQDLPHHPAQ